MRIEYGPPGHKGVTQIMGLGADPVAVVNVAKNMSKSHRTVGLLAAATWAGGMVMGSNTAKNIGIGGLLAIIYVEMLKPKVAAESPAAPTSVQGWG